ncbi:MAG: repeat protein, partial [Pedosphaera sp.]|nr:repeat protein [Pedosphaera sp.]
NQKVTLFERDNAGRLITVTNANQELTRFAYDAADRIKTLTDGLSHVTTWNYNQFGWLLNKVDATNHTVLTNGYDANGRLTTRWLPASGKTIYTYDPVGNLTNVDYSTGTIPTPAVRFAYDALNRLRTMADGVGTTTLSNTPTGQLLSEDGPWTSDTISYTYYQGQLTNLSLAQPSASPWTQAYGYDSMWRLQTLASPAGNFGYGYSTANPASTLVQSIALPNFASITNQYDSLARLTNTALQNYWGHVLDGYGYGLDYLGLRKNLTRNLGLTTNGVAVGYDNIGQLTSWSATETNGTLRLNEQLGYGYDKADNLNLRTNNALVQTFNVDTVNQLTTVTRAGTFTFSGATPAPASSLTVNGAAAQSYGDFTFAKDSLTLANGNNTFSVAAQNAYGVAASTNLTVNLPATVTMQYDLNGNLTGDGTRAFVYDAENQLTNVNVAGQWKTEFVYDGAGRRRIARDYNWQGGAWTQTNETHYVYDGMLVIQERNGSNVPQVTYTRGLDLSGGLLARTDGNGSVFYHSDGGDNVTALMDGNQNIVARYLYDPFGKPLGRWGQMADINHYRFSGQEVHPNSGLYYYGFRFYEPNFQRWLNHDPLGEAGGINLYGFVSNDPLNRIDLYGLAGFGELRVAEAAYDRNVALQQQLMAEDARLRRLPTFQRFSGQLLEILPPRVVPADYGAHLSSFNKWVDDAIRSAGRPYKYDVDSGGVYPRYYLSGTPPCVGMKGLGGGAKAAAAESTASRLGNLTPSQARKIQAFSDRFGAEVNVVGSRAAGEVGPLSDFDYVIGGTGKLRHAAEHFLPRNPESTGTGIGNLPFRGIDIFDANGTPLDPTRPFIQFTPGKPPVVGPK